MRLNWGLRSTWFVNTSFLCDSLPYLLSCICKGSSTMNLMLPNVWRNSCCWSVVRVAVCLHCTRMVLTRGNFWHIFSKLVVESEVTSEIIQKYQLHSSLFWKKLSFISKENIILHETISPRAQLEAVLPFLITGDSNTSLHFISLPVFREAL